MYPELIHFRTVMIVTSTRVQLGKICDGYCRLGIITTATYLRSTYVRFRLELSLLDEELNVKDSPLLSLSRFHTFFFGAQASDLEPLKPEESSD